MVESLYIIPDAPRLALLSDLHGRPYQEAVFSLQRNKPDIICITGDIIYGIWPADDISPLVSQPYVLPFLERCAGIAPTYLSLGNHEQALDQKDFETIVNTGVTVLDNNWAQRNGVVIGGLTSAYVTDYRRAKPKDSTCRYPKLQHVQFERKPETEWMKEYAAEPGYHVLLSHHPEYYPMIPDNVELMLSGHAHGGQIRLFNRGLFAPGQGWWPKWTKGAYDNRLIISAGLSNTASPIPRLFNPTEVLYVFPEAESRSIMN